MAEAGGRAPSGGRWHVGGMQPFTGMQRQFSMAASHTTKSCTAGAQKDGKLLLFGTRKLELTPSSGDRAPGRQRLQLSVPLLRQHRHAPLQPATHRQASFLGPSSGGGGFGLGCSPARLPS